MASEFPTIEAWVGRGEQASPTAYNWWKQPVDKVPSSVFGLVQYIDNNQRSRTDLNTYYARLYANEETLSLNPLAPGQGRLSRAPRYLTLNVVSSCVDTATAKVGKNRPRPQFLTIDGDFTMKRRAKLLTQYCEGIFDAAQVYTKGSSVFRDAAVQGTGCLKVYKDVDRGSVNCERVLIDELIVDDVEAAYGEPEQVHQRKLVSRDRAIEMFPKNKDDLLRCGRVVISPALRTAADQIMIVESWHLPSGPKAKDGRHVICCEKAVLFEEEWTKDHFPFVTLRWADKQIGFWGRGLAEELRGIQAEINRVVNKISQAQRLVANPRVYIDVDSAINTADLNDMAGGIVKYRGSPPSFQTPVAMNGEMYSYLEGLIDKAYKFTGISQMSAQSTKEPGITSGVAIREVADLGSERFMLVAERYEQFYMDVAKLFIELSRELYEDDKQLSVTVKDRRFIRKIKWKDVDLAEDMYEMRVFPTALLPSTPAGKLQATQELYEAGFIDQDEAKELLDIPDLESVMSLRNAARECVERQVEMMVDDGTPQTPEPFMNLQLAQSVVQNTYLKMVNESLSEDRLQLLRDYMDECSRLMQPPPPSPEEAAVAGPPPAGPPSGPAPAPPGGPPMGLS